MGVSTAGGDGILRPHRIREYPRTDGIHLALPQDGCHAFRQDDGAHAMICLRLTDGILTLPLTVEGAAYLQRTSVLVEVVPL